MAAVGFRFHPTDEELIAHYLKRKMNGHDALVDQVMGEVDVYRLEPSDLPYHSLNGSSEDQVWYFFCRPDYKYKNSRRASRANESGFWKITGKPRFILARDSGDKIGVKKTLVFFYKARGDDAKPISTDWVIHEYNATERLPDQREYVICKLKHKGDDWTKGKVSNNGELSHTTPVSDVEDHGPAIPVQESAPAMQSPVCFEEGISIDDFLEDINFTEKANNGSTFRFESDEEVDPDSYLVFPDDSSTMHALPNDHTPEKSLSTYHPDDSIAEVNVINTVFPEICEVLSEVEASSTMVQWQGARAAYTRSSTLMPPTNTSYLKAARKVEETTGRLTRAAEAGKGGRLPETARSTNSVCFAMAQHSGLKLSPAASAAEVCKRPVSIIHMVEIPASQVLSPPTVYIANILVALLVFAFFISDLPFLR
ncbi:unnamed protein product [Linum trigynum]|uniref:NAC domain-containing protein n=1 Tax=Linum trigynum TaxID=586398 RepID=A0AAV2FLI7_9ROSI